MKWLTIASNLVYPIAGWFGDWVTFGAGIILMLGSGWMHWQEEYSERTELAILSDWFGMYAFSLSVFGFITNYWVLTLLIPIAILRNEMRDNKLIALLVLLIIAIAQSWIALIVFVVATATRFKWEDSPYQDYSHMAWHLLTALGYYILITQ